MKKEIRNGICLLFFFALMFFSGRGVAQLRVEKTMEILSVRAEADNWGLGFGAEGTQPTGNVSADELKKYDAYYVGGPSEKVLYLTFDCGYENGNTEPILDALKTELNAVLR